MNLTRKAWLLFQSFHRYNCSAHGKVPFVKVLSSDEEDTVRLSFKYSQSSTLVVKAPKEESIQNVLSRIKLAANLQRQREEFRQDAMSRLLNIRQDAKQKTEEDITVCLLRNDDFLNENISNVEAWTQASQLKIGDAVYEIKYNEPTVVGLSLPEYILAGCSLRPRFRLEVANLEDCRFTWYRSQPKENALKLLNVQGPDDIIIEEDKCWLKVSEGFIYTTCTEDIDCFLKIICTPRRGDFVGNDYSVESVAVVEAAPERIPFEERQKHTKTLTNDDSIRCVSYNTLANNYVERKKFPYCSERARNIYYRKQLLFKEIIGYNSDILCLQEIEERMFIYDFLPILKKVGFDGYYKKKGGRMNEGLTTFFRSSKFKLVDSFGLLLNELIYQDIYKDLRAKIGRSNKDIGVLLKQDSAFQITLLQHIKYPDRKVLVANTHLYSNKDSPEVRLIQAAVCTNYIEHFIKMKALDSVAVLFCGDFNSRPCSDTYDFMTSGKCCPTWKNGVNSDVDTTLLHNLHLGSACGTPDYTNYTEEFYGCLDYIFYSKSHLKVTEVVPMPRHEDVIAHTGLPNEVFPSDHIALVCTLKWNNL